MVIEATIEGFEKDVPPEFSPRYQSWKHIVEPRLSTPATGGGGSVRMSKPAPVVDVHRGLRETKGRLKSNRPSELNALSLIVVISSEVGLRQGECGRGERGTGTSLWRRLSSLFGERAHILDTRSKSRNAGRLSWARGCW
jgi:hypothetical protein